jgi:hypothetical protein
VSPAQFDLTMADQTEFILGDQSLDEVFLTINGERYYLWRAVLLEAVWSATTVTEAALSVCIGEIRHLLGDRPSRHSLSRRCTARLSVQRRILPATSS